MNNDFDELGDLERELGETLRQGLRRAAATIADDRPARQQPPGITRPPSFTQQEDRNMIELENTTDQRQRRRNRHRLVAAGGVVAAGVVAIAVVIASRDDDTAPVDVPAPTVTEAAVPTSEYVLSVNALAPVEVTLEVPARWDSFGDTAIITEMSGRETYISVWDVEYVYTDPCHHSGTAEEIGPTVGDLAVALEQQPMRDATVTDVEVDGFAGKQVRMSVPDDIDFADCDMGQFRSWVGRNHQGAGQRDDVYILDVDGIRVVLDVTYFPNLPPTDTDELASIVQSIRINSPDVSEAPSTTS